MNTKNVLWVVFIFICTTVAWAVLGGSLMVRSNSSDIALKGKVETLWGGEHHQQAPLVYYQVERQVKRYDQEAKKEIVETVKDTYYVEPTKSDLAVDLGLDYRQKGLLWYSTYRVAFAGTYRFKNRLEVPQTYYVHFSFPTSQAIYDDFQLIVDGKKFLAQGDLSSGVTAQTEVTPGEEKEFKVTYRSQGLDRWKYSFGSGVTRVQDFSLVTHTDFRNVDFPEQTISPTEKHPSGAGWDLSWKFQDLVAGFAIGIEMPKKLNPGPLASKITFFAPVPLFLFFFTLLLFAAMRKVTIHSLNYFFLAAAFFAFHLLYAYLVDHISIHLAFVLSSFTSLILVVTYLRLVVNWSFAFREAGLSQILFLVLFSYAFFYPGFTGLIITIGCIVTLFILMQITGKVRWGAA
jgi:inner membrane protein involved in colicin E2 resistance